jgi:hypothetical protein
MVRKFIKQINRFELTTSCFDLIERVIVTKTKIESKKTDQSCIGTSKN